jgi:hypothetical protein
MRRIANARIAALVAAVVAGALAAYTLQPGSATTGHVTQQTAKARPTPARP